MHHIFVSKNFIDEDNKCVIVEKDADSENFTHLTKSLRVNVGEQVLCSPIPFNFTYDYKCKIIDIDKTYIKFSIEEKKNASELRYKINIYQGIPKSDKLEFIIEKAVELGVYSITPVEMTNSISKINDKTDKKIERYSKIAKSAAEQSKRNIIPKIKKPIDYKKMLDEIKENDALNILFYEDAAGIEKTKNIIKTNEKDIINVIIGPEGGFTEKEIDDAKSSNIEILSLGKRILRTETAAITALSIIMYETEI